MKPGPIPVYVHHRIFSTQPCAWQITKTFVRWWKRKWRCYLCFGEGHWGGGVSVGWLLENLVLRSAGPEIPFCEQPLRIDTHRCSSKGTDVQTRTHWFRNVVLTRALTLPGQHHSFLWERHSVAKKTGPFWSLSPFASEHHIWNLFQEALKSHRDLDWRSL